MKHPLWTIEHGRYVITNLGRRFYVDRESQTYRSYREELSHEEFGDQVGLLVRLID